MIKKLWPILILVVALLVGQAENAFAQVTTVGGGTGSTSPSGILIGVTGNLHLQTLKIGTGLTLTGTTLAATGGSGGTPGGLNAQIQYNNAGAFGGITGATTDGTAVSLSGAHLLNPTINGAGTGLATLTYPNTSTSVTITFPSTTNTLATLAGAEALTNKSVNAVTLTAAGSASTYLNGAGAYTTPAGSTYTGTYPIIVTGSVISSGFSTTTNSGMAQGFQYIGSGGIFQTAASSSLFGFTPLNPTRNINTTAPLTGGGALTSDLTLGCASCSTFAFPFTPTSYGNATGTLIGFTNGILVVGSSTIIGNATTTGMHAFGNVRIPGLGIAAGQFAAFDPNGVLIGTTTPINTGGSSEGVQWATAAVLAGTPTYSNGTAGVGATLTEVGTGALVVDGNNPVSGDRVLVKNQASAFQNGIYTVTVTGSGIASYVLTRSSDYNSSTEITPGLTTYVVSGTANLDTTWAVNFTVPLTMGTTNLNYTKVSGGGAAVTSVSNSDSTLTITPTTGNVVGSLNLAHANVWSALQTFSNATSSLFSTTYGSTTNAFIGTLTLPQIGTAAGTFIAVDPTGKIIATTTPTGGGTASNPTFQTLTSTSYSTYTTPANVTELVIRMVGAGGGGGAAVGNAGTQGGTSSFGTGLASTTTVGGVGGNPSNTNFTVLNPMATGGLTNIGTAILRVAGQSAGSLSTIGNTSLSPQGISTPLGGGGSAANTNTGQAASANSGSGGGGGETASAQGQGGSAGEYVEFKVTSPSASYKYQIGAGGTAGTGTQGGGLGADGVIIVEEFYH